MNFSNTQEWIDGFSSLENYSRVSIDTWYKMRPKIVSYPETISPINPGFDDSIIDKAIITLVTEKDPAKIDFAKNSLVERMKEYYSFDSSVGVADQGVSDMNSALDNDRAQQAGDAASGEKPPIQVNVNYENDINDGLEFNPSNNFSNEATSLAGYIAEKHKLDVDKVAAALNDMSSQPYPMSHTLINNFLCNRYNFPINNDGDVVSRVSEFLNSNIDIKDAKQDRLSLAKTIVNKFFPADNFLVMDILNVYMDPKLDKLMLPGVLQSLLMYSGISADTDKISQMILALSDTFRRYDMEIQGEEAKNFARRDAIAILNQTCKDHRLKLASNEIKWIYDTFIDTKLDEVRTAQMIQGVETESGRLLHYDTALEVIKDFRARCKEARITDGFVTFAKPRGRNFNKIAESAFELSNIAAQAGIDDRYVFDHYDELAGLLMKSSSTEDLHTALMNLFLNGGYTDNPEEAALIADDFIDTLRGSDWAKEHMALGNFARNDLINRMFSLGYTDRDIAIKLHEPLASVRNFSGDVLKETVENLRNEPGFNLLVDKRGDNFTFLLRIVQVLLAAGIAYKFILPHLKDFYYALTNRQKTDAEKYEEIKQIIEENQRYRMNSDRSAQALLQLQSMMQPQTNISGLSKSMWGM